MSWLRHLSCGGRGGPDCPPPQLRSATRGERVRHRLLVAALEAEPHGGVPGLVQAEIRVTRSQRVNSRSLAASNGRLGTSVIENSSQSLVFAWRVHRPWIEATEVPAHAASQLHTPSRRSVQPRDIPVRSTLRFEACWRVRS